MGNGFKVLIEGDYACFTRPELKVERVSYDVPPPGAIEGMLKSVYWKPAIAYVIDKIVVYNPINFMNIRRNEVKDKIGKKTSGDISIYASESRTQRASLILKNVKYGVEFHFEMTGNKSQNEDESPGKHYNIIKRRLEKGQCFRTPCMGCSEFPARHITLVEDFNFEDIHADIIKLGEVDLGYMSYRVKFEDGGMPKNGDWDNPKFSDSASTQYYRPKMIRGVIDVGNYRQSVRG